MVDIDTIDESKILLKIIKDLNIGCAVLKTNKGIHLYFKSSELTKNSIEWYSPVGINVTIKLGVKNTADPLKINGKTRKWLVKTNEYDELPKWLYPMDKKRNHITDIDEGNRNQELFNYILKLQSIGMNKKEIRQTIKIINKYFLTSSLDDNEINVILRDDAFLKESFFKGNLFLHDHFAKFLISEHNIISIMEVLHIYKDGIYSDNQNEIERAMIKYLSTLTKARRVEVLSYIQLKAEDKQLASVNYIAVNNGILDINTWKLLPFDPAIIIKNKIPVNYVADAYYATTDKTLNKIACYDKSLRKVLEEIFGYILLRRNELGKAFILTGCGSNGKSSYLKMVRALAGQENTSSLDLKELNQRFKTAELFGKLANIGDDISGEYIKDNSEFKKLVTGEQLNVERKGRDPFDFSNYAKLIFSANRMPRINDTSNGLMRRLMMIPFNAKFTANDKDFDPFIQDKLLSKESMEYILQLAIQGLQRLLKNQKFSPSRLITKETAKYEEQNNPIIGFLKETQPKLENEIVADVHCNYQVWCVENGYQATSSSVFSREINRLKNLSTKLQRINKKPKKIFIRNER
ncbi:phage/plasmid primase, P4 family [Melissococcus plutonius]|uniref:phage/plasmid primase, P4 family n=1 Tax=Melissococcus plutonius TaxID=33970 RepID=UPI0021E5B4FA|nr:phage/plasmid primase, P4 family [Melissococcus plutonius]MCV2499608.1 phage/plasmid primase, P4 family [Melissococcus plutonius]MCV2501528.1 phage/plasmid primase, P4 family [Melissococcus plutonius]MCV2505971.1 phage/plasmid primase, P4 family [Melissococcus plutonius]MCV2508212.1 phage/plasmid primase, P4 family [Melissococcus plutonius]MCV2520000.1 phage/plasmid primase, P4 family [Melissococcus plutonius]